MRRFDGKVAVITGGSSGIGRATAIKMAKMGAAVMIGARGAERAEKVVAEVRADGGRALFQQTDVGHAEQVKRLIDRAVAEYGRVDFGFNNAAIVGDRFRPTADFKESDFDAVMAANFKGVWLCMKYEIQQMLDQRPSGGAIVNTSSINGLGGTPLASLYAASKAGVLGLTKSAALEYATQNIRINALAAGAFDTPMLRGAMDQMSGGASPEEMEQRYIAMIPQRRIGAPDEAANVVCWLCSDEASYVTGHSMIVDGGMTAPMR